MLIWHASEYNITELKILLAGSTKSKASASTLTDLDAVSKTLAKNPETQLILLYRPAVETVCMAMKQGATPGEALKGWIKETRQILTLQRKNRSRTTLFDLEMIRLFPAQFADLVGIPKLDVQEAIANLDSLQTTDPVLFLMAYHSLQTSPAARQISDEIEACAPDLANGAEIPALDVDQVLQAYRDDLQRGRTKQDQQKAQNKILTEQFELSKKELEDNLVQITKVELNHKKAQKDNLVQVEKLHQEHEQKQLHFQLQTETLENELTVIYSENNKQKNKIKALLNTEQVLTAKTGTLNKQLDTLKQKETQLKQRLEQLGAGMDSFQTQLKSKTSDLDKKEKELVIKIQELNAKIRENLSAQQNAKQLHQEVNRLNNSHSMKITAPLRWLFKILGRK